jgi:hypothetical protein
VKSVAFFVSLQQISSKRQDFENNNKDYPTLITGSDNSGSDTQT